MITANPGQSIGGQNTNYLLNRLIDRNGLNRGKYPITINDGDEVFFTNKSQQVKALVSISVGPEWTSVSNCFFKRLFKKFVLCKYLENKGIEVGFGRLGDVYLRTTRGDFWKVYIGDEILKEKK